MTPRRSILAGSILGALVLPAAASAATFTVDPAAAPGCAASVCKTITDANAKVADGDTVSIKAGTFQEAPIVVTRRNVTFSAAEPGKVNIATNSATADAATFTLGDGTGAGTGTVLRGLAVGVPVTGGSAVLVRAAGTSVEQSTLVRLGATSDQPVYAVDDAGSGITGGINAIRASFVIQFANPAEVGAAPGVRGGGETSLVIEDSTVVAGEKSGTPVVLNANDQASDKNAIANSITRGTILAQKPAAPAVEVLSGATSAVPKATVLDSVILSPGADGPGLRAASIAGNAAQGSTAGDITVTARHVTVAGGGRPFALDAAALPMPAPPPLIPGAPVTASPPVGRIAVTADRSIVHGRAASTVTAAAGNQFQTGSSARLTLKDSDATDVAGGTDAAQTTRTGTITTTADEALFRNLAARDFHLKASAPVVDKGGPQVAGESAKDFENQVRVTGAASDLGGDEYENSLPTVTLKADRTQIKQGESIAFDATGATDTDGPLTRFLFNFGDGSPIEENATGRATHQFTKVGTYNVAAAVVDAAGAPAFAVVPVTVIDATAPTVAITSPKSGSSLKLFNVKVLRKALKASKGRKRTRVTTSTTLRRVLFTGTAADEAGVRFVELSLRRVSLRRGKVRVGRVVKTVTAKSRAVAGAGSCTFLDQKAKRFVGRPCAKPVFFTVAFKEGKFAFQLKKDIPYRQGTYVLSARATDVSGVVSVPVTSSFTLR